MSPGHVRGRRATTLHGEMAYERSVYECPQCRCSVAPLDWELGLGPHEHLTGRAVKKVAYEVADSSFPQSAKNIEHQADIHVSPAECARIAAQHGARVDALQREREAAWVRPVGEGDGPAAPEIQAQRLVIEADAAAVLTVADEEHKMIYCGTAFAAEDRLTKETATERPMIVRRRYTAAADFEDFRDRLKALACRMGVARAMLVAFIGDGAACLWALARDLFPRAVFIQDFWHVCEHLKELLGDLFGEGSVADALYEKWKTALWESRLDDILADLQSEQKRRRGGKRERIEREITYLQNGRERMDYARFRAEGWPIGSGAAEGTCKHLIKERFNVTGARWKRAKIPHVLALRLSKFNEEWEDDWANLRAA